MESNSSAKEREFEAQFVVKREIGSGTFGTVKKCLWKKDGKIYAVKTIDNVNGMNIDKIQEEAEIMTSVSSDYSLSLVDHFFDQRNSSYIFVMPYCKMGSLETIMLQNWPLDKFLLFLYQICQAMMDFSEKEILHLDLKPQNILLKKQDEYLVCDFGCSKVIQGMAISKNFLKMSYSKGMGTAEYASPEIQTDSSANKYSDVWSLGIILYKILYKKSPFNKKGAGLNFGAYKAVFQGHKKQFEPLIPILKRMISQKNRPKWTEIVNKIYEIIGIQEKKTTIVTSNSQFVQYLKNVCIMITCMTEILEHSAVTDLEKKQRDQRFTLSRKFFIRVCGAFLKSFTNVALQTYTCQEGESQKIKQASQSIQSVKTQSLFYLFQNTKRRVSLDEKQKVRSLKMQSGQLSVKWVQMYSLSSQLQGKIEAALSSQHKMKMLFLDTVKTFEKQLKSQEEITMALKVNNELQWFKVEQIFEFIRGTQFAYRSKNQLKNLSKFLIYS